MRFFILAVFLVLVQISLCSSNYIYPWVRPTDLNKGLPSSVQIYTLNTSTSPYNTKLTGGYVSFDFSDPNLEFVVAHDENQVSKTPMQYAEQDPHVVYAVINGGYFDVVKNISSSYICQNGTVYHKNTLNFGTNIYPTVGAFGHNESTKHFSAQYIYSYGQTLETYKFAQPNPYPGPEPVKTNGSIWHVDQGIGAGPILVKNGFVVGGNPEHFNAGNMINFRHPRSAICVDINGNLLFVAIDGRYDGSDGMMMPELAEMMQTLDCHDAMNLDGGGSTLLYANNKIINRPSDAAGPRPVVSAVYVRDKFKKKVGRLNNQLRVE